MKPSRLLVPLACAAFGALLVPSSAQAGRPVAAASPVAVGTVPPALANQEGLAVPGRPALVLSGEQLAEARELRSLDESQVRWLKPKASALPPNPHATTDFTAHTLQFGEVKIGLLTAGAGVLPNVQLTTMPALDYLGLPNAQVKLRAIHAGPVDLAVTGQRTWIGQEGFRAALTGVGAVASLRIVPSWSIHGGASYSGLSAKGVPDLCSLSPLLTDACLQTNVSTSPTEPVEPGNPFGIAGNDLYGELLTVRVATDVRFNRRDSLILQGTAVPFARVQLDEDIDVPHIAQLDTVLAFDGRVPLTEAYMVSLAYQMAWKNVHLRVGLGTSTLPMAWLTQTTELSMHFGGKDAFERTKQRVAWRRNKREANRGLDVCAASRLE
ncbi:MAG: hypothetical protein ABIO70_06405 [Pseudomonadota bacterium]